MNSLKLVMCLLALSGCCSNPSTPPTRPLPAADMVSCNPIQKIQDSSGAALARSIGFLVLDQEAVCLRQQNLIDWINRGK